MSEVSGEDIFAQPIRFISYKLSTPTTFQRLDLFREFSAEPRRTVIAFFLVKDISADELATIKNAREFRERYGVARSDVQRGEIAIIRRRDGVKFALETVFLRNIIRTARDYSWFTTQHFETADLAVFFPPDRECSRLATAYIRAGEREHWNLAPSFQAVEAGGGHWFVLRDADTAPILFVKTMQYSPFVLFNDANMLTNQRLYKVTPNGGIDPAALCAILNSTIFASERYAAVKALGKEAAIDVEVFSAKAFRIPDIRQFPNRIQRRLHQSMQSLSERRVATLLEDHLLQAGYAEAVAYAQQHQIGQDVWPTELRDPIRQEIDRLVLQGIGVPEGEIPDYLNRLYDELTEHVRKLRIVELEAQANRRGRVDNVEPSSQQLADDIWAQIVGEGDIEPRLIPTEFISERMETIEFVIPSGRFVEHPPSLFDKGGTFAFNIGSSLVEVDAEEKVTLIRTLVRLGVKGPIQMPLRVWIAHD
jgi:hypothetical protein